MLAKMALLLFGNAVLKSFHIPLTIQISHYAISSCFRCWRRSSVAENILYNKINEALRSCPIEMKFRVQRQLEQACKGLKFGIRWMNSMSSRSSELRLQQVHIRSDSQSDNQNYCCSLSARLRLSCVGWNNASPKNSCTLETNVGTWKMFGLKEAR